MTSPAISSKIGDADITFDSLESAFPVLSVTASSEGSERGVSNRIRRSRGGLSVPRRTKDFDYPRYLASREWSLLREQVRERSGDKCEHCRVAPQQAVHHLTYERIGHEDLSDLLTVCNPCHEWFSGKESRNPFSQAWLYCGKLIDTTNEDKAYHLVYATHGAKESRRLHKVPCNPHRVMGFCLLCKYEPFCLHDFMALWDYWEYDE